MEKTHEAQESSGNFKRTMKARHLIMLSLGGVIGTGLFYNTGVSLPRRVRSARCSPTPRVRS